MENRSGKVPKQSPKQIQWNPGRFSLEVTTRSSANSAVSQTEHLQFVKTLLLGLPDFCQTSATVSYRKKRRQQRRQRQSPQQHGVKTGWWSATKCRWQPAKKEKKNQNSSCPKLPKLALPKFRSHTKQKAKFQIRSNTSDLFKWRGCKYAQTFFSTPTEQRHGLPIEHLLPSLSGLLCCWFPAPCEQAPATRLMHITMTALTVVNSSTCRNHHQSHQIQRFKGWLPTKSFPVNCISRVLETSNTHIRRRNVCVFVKLFLRERFPIKLF